MPMTDWGDVYFRALGRGYDHGYASYLADRWAERQKKKVAKPVDEARKGLTLTDENGQP